jgi:hypothetical protein
MNMENLIESGLTGIAMETGGTVGDMRWRKKENSIPIPCSQMALLMKPWVNPNVVRSRTPQIRLYLRTFCHLFYATLGLTEPEVGKG